MKENFFSYIDSCLNEDKLPHAFLIETNNISCFYDEIITFLSKKHLIKNSVIENNLNVIIIAPDGKEIKTGAIDYLQQRFSIMPVHDKYNIFIIKEADKMNVSAINKLLKFLEEPNNSIVGFLIIGMDSKIISTIKSRCQIFKIDYQLEERDITKQLNMLLNITKRSSFEQEIEFKTIFTNIERSELITIFQNAISTLEIQLSTIPNEIDRITRSILLFDKILHLLKSNVNIDLVLDKLCIEAR